MKQLGCLCSVLLLLGFGSCWPYRQEVHSQMAKVEYYAAV